MSKTISDCLYIIGQVDLYVKSTFTGSVLGLFAGLNAFNERSAVRRGALVGTGFSPRGFVPSGPRQWVLYGTFVPIGAGYTEKDWERIEFLEGTTG